MSKDIRKGIILAGGKGTRLFPITKGISKQLMPVYDKPMIYYPLCTLMLAGIKEFLVITNPNDKIAFENLLEDGSKWGIKINYKIQMQPDGIASALILGEEFLANSPSALILGDNLFHGENLINKLKVANKKIDSSTIFAYAVSDPERYGVVDFDSSGKALSIEEKPKIPKSRYAITGLYFFDKNAPSCLLYTSPSPRD